MHVINSTKGYVVLDKQGRYVGTTSNIAEATTFAHSMEASLTATELSQFVTFRCWAETP